MIVRIGQAVVECAVAATPGEHRVGLSKTESLAPGMGMLFTPTDKLERDRPLCFWMPRRMRFGLDIVYIGANKRVRAVHPDCWPDDKRYPGFACWVLEVPAGFCKSVGIEVGQEAAFDEVVEHESMQSSDVLRGLVQARMAYTRNYEEETLVVKGTKEAIGVLEDMIKHIHQASRTGHSFYVVCDPDSSEVKKFGIDGDGAFRVQSVTRLVARGAQSTETAPYSRAPSIAPTTSPQDRFQNVSVPSGTDSVDVTQGPIHDESWNSPTRASKTAGFTQGQDDVGRTYDYDAKLEESTSLEIPGLPKESCEVRYVQS